MKTSDDSYRLRLDRRFTLNSYLGEMVQYLETHKPGSQTSESIIETIEARFLPLSLKHKGRIEQLDEVYRCIFILESFIRVILNVWEISDPRVSDSQRRTPHSDIGEHVHLANEADIADQDSDVAAIQSVIDTLEM